MRFTQKSRFILTTHSSKGFRVILWLLHYNNLIKQCDAFWPPTSSSIVVKQSLAYFASSFVVSVEQVVVGIVVKRATQTLSKDVWWDVDIKIHMVVAHITDDFVAGRHLKLQNTSSDAAFRRHHQRVLCTHSNLWPIMIAYSLMIIAATLRRDAYLQTLPKYRAVRKSVRVIGWKEARWKCSGYLVSGK